MCEAAPSLGSTAQVASSAATFAPYDPPSATYLPSRSRVHSATLPVRSSRPSGVAPSGRDPGPSGPSAQGPATSPNTARRQTSPVGPQAKRRPAFPAAAINHSSVLGSLPPEKRQKRSASSGVTAVTGRPGSGSRSEGHVPALV